MDIILGEIGKAVGLLVGVGLILFVYGVAKGLTKESEKSAIMNLIIGLLVSLAIAGAMSLRVGAPTCLDSDTDNRGSTCLQYADDGYTPSNEERIGVFGRWLILSSFPILLGVNSGNRKKTDAEKGHEES